MAELEQVKAKHCNKNIATYSQDANIFIPEFCRKLKHLDRAVVLLDPFSTQLEWNTLAPIARSEKIDLWLLFPISVILRMTPKHGAKIKPEWKETLGQMVGHQRLGKSTIQTCHPKDPDGPLFLFYFAVSSRSPKARGLASKVSKDILAKHNT